MSTRTHIEVPPSVMGKTPTTMETYTGLFVDAVDLKVEDVVLKDVAHSLSLICRYGGHCSRFYSVAEHSIHCHDEALRRGYSRNMAMRALLHDAGEAYWHDMGRPLKVAKGMKGYLKLLDNAQRVAELGLGGWTADEHITKHFLISLAGTPYIDGRSEKEIVKEIDNGVLMAEAVRLMPSKGESWVGYENVEVAIIPRWKWWWYRKPRRAERGFIRRYMEWQWEDW